MTRVPLAVILLISVSLPGCEEAPVTMAGPETQAYAVYTKTTAAGVARTIEAAWSWDSAVRAQDDSILAGYTLRFEDSEHTGLEFEWVFDGSLTPIRQSTKCPQLDDCVELIQYIPYSFLSDLGFSYLATYNLAGELRFKDPAIGVMTSAEPIVTTSGGRTNLTIPRGNLDSDMVRYAGTYIYSDSSIFPISSKSASGVEWLRTQYQASGSIGYIPDWPQAAPLAANPRGSEIFPGANHDDFGMGFTATQALDHLLQQQPDAGLMLNDGGCVVRYEVYFPPDDSGGILPPDPLARPLAEVYISIGNRAATQGKVWDLFWQSNALGQKQFAAVTPGSESTPPPMKGGCDKARSLPEPILSSTEFLALSDKIKVSSEAPPWFIWTFLPDGFSPPGTLSGWDKYGRAYKPEGVPANASGIFFPNTQVMDANRAWWVFLSLPARDVEAFDMPAP